VHEAELAMRMQSTKLRVALHRCPAIDAGVDHSNAIDDATIVLGARVQSLDHEPLIGMSVTHVRPAHAPRYPPTLTADNFSTRRVLPRTRSACWSSTGVAQIASVLIQLALFAFGAIGLVQRGIEALQHAGSG
jgi:hypothetical protein